MSAVPFTALLPGGDPLELVPRLRGQGYAPEHVAQRRAWVERQTGVALRHVGAASLPTESLRGNVENPVGAAQVPLGVAGPLLIHGQEAHGTFYVPLATSEGALVRSYERGMVTLTRAGGVTTRVYLDENRVSPIFLFADVAEAHAFAQRLPEDFAALKAEAEATTRHGKLLRVECCPVGRDVIVHFCYHTADAHGMNMIVKATDAACRWVAARYAVRRHYVLSGLSSEKRASGALFAGGKGKKVVAGALVPAGVARAYLHASPAALCDVWRRTALASWHNHTVGFNAHLANGLTALFIACGQDVANVVNAAVGITHFEQTDAGDLYASVTLPALTVGTVGGGTGLATSRECLALLGCAGPGKARKFAEIVAGTLLAGELSMAAALASGEFVAAHEQYGRNRPQPEGPP
jgi:hydroxymethylglutaryl-CoA reductase (NADPH)